MFWRYTPSLLIGLPACALGVYLIYRFAVESVQGAVIVAVGVFVWITASIIWGYVIHPKLLRKRD